MACAWASEGGERSAIYGVHSVNEQLIQSEYATGGFFHFATCGRDVFTAQSPMRGTVRRCMLCTAVRACRAALPVC